MAKLKIEKMKEGDQYWRPSFDTLVNIFESSLVEYDLGCWGDFEDGWAFDNMEDCDALCEKLNKSIAPHMGRNKNVYGRLVKNFRLLQSSTLKSGVPINFFVPKEGMGEIPESLIQSEIDKANLEHYYYTCETGSSKWSGGNYDAGIFDALMVRNYQKNRMDVYFCAILRRPFSEEEADRYGSIFLKDLKYRLSHIYDNHENSGFNIF